MHRILISVNQACSCSFHKKSMQVNICGEWDFSCSQSFLPAGSEIAVWHVNGNIFPEHASGSELLQWLFTNKMAEQVMNCGNIFWHTLKGRCIEACEGQALTKMSNMGAGWSRRQLMIAEYELTKAPTRLFWWKEEDPSCK